MSDDGTWKKNKKMNGIVDEMYDHMIKVSGFDKKSIGLPEQTSDTDQSYYEPFDHHEHQKSLSRSMEPEYDKLVQGPVSATFRVTFLSLMYQIWNGNKLIER